MSILTRPLTYDDLIQMPEDGKRYEIIGGELVVSAAPIPKHQLIIVRLTVLIYTFVTTHRLGFVLTAPCDVILAPHDIVDPDILFISGARRHIIGPKTIEGAPDLVIEVLSPSTRARDESLKAALYAANGVHEYWLADPEAETLAMFALDGGAYVEVAESRVLDGLVVDKVALFADLP